MKRFGARRAGPVGGFMAAALLQLRHHQLDKVDPALRVKDAGQVKAVDAGLIHPVDQRVGHLRRRAANQRIATAQRVLLQQPAAGPAVVGLADRGDRPGIAGADRPIPRKLRAVEADRTG